MEAVTALAQVCDPEVFGDIDPEKKTNCENCSEYLNSMLGSADSVFSHCSHLHAHEICSELFEPVMTESGVCYKYNGLEVHRKNRNSTEEWTLEEGYRSSIGHAEVYPRTGSKFSLNLDLKVDNRLNDGLCKGPIQGFKVFLHLPNEAPQISKHYYLVPYKHTVEISLIPKMIITAPELRDFSVHKRRCYFNDERYLRFFKYYTQNNCELECLANLTVSKCGCQRFYMPSELES
jgi:acid-sensing ion channel, other